MRRPTTTDGSACRVSANAVGEFGAEQDQSFAAEVQQGVDHLRLTVGRRHRTEHHLVSGASASATMSSTISA